jgi:alkanesulfonate monooxygenase SsuD/methylene tetrahydromethanopterin reductase-like flavin-dependent oxidoreductase (luciferase family)
MAQLELVMRFDLRAPAWGTPTRQLYLAMLEMSSWADDNGFNVIRVSEHHASEDGYCPSPLTALSAIAARTKHARLRAMALVLPLHDPLRIAEDAAVLDIVSGGRAELAVGAGYRHEEFAMFGRARKERARLVEEGIRVLRHAWSGRPFDYRGGQVVVTPTPVQVGGPPILLAGSSEVAARRAARIADGFVPMDAALFDAYADELRALGKPIPPSFPRLGPPFVYVAEDPEEAWARLLPHAKHASKSYANWFKSDNGIRPSQVAEDPSVTRNSPAYQVVTPDECVSIIEELGSHAIFTLHPLLAGVDPDFAWKSLELFAAKVLPQVGRRDGGQNTQYAPIIKLGNKLNDQTSVTAP